ncbi:MAG: DinB family protein [Thermomicrobiales bacterium]
MSQIPADIFRANVLQLLDETFEHVHGYILDRGTSLFETLATIDAATASRVFSPRASTIAAQVNHTRFYLDVLLRNMRDGDTTPADWDSSWQVTEVTPEEWDALIAGLRASYDEIKTIAANLDEWTDDAVGGAMAIIAHSAYHLGEIRLSLAALQIPE